MELSQTNDEQKSLIEIEKKYFDRDKKKIGNLHS